MYETVFGVFNHVTLGHTKPMASVALHEVEDVNTNDALRSTMLNYIRNDIKELFGLSFLEYVALPSFIVKEFNDTAVIARKEKSDMLNSAMGNMNT
jgi:hypothetical protein